MKTDTTLLQIALSGVLSIALTAQADIIWDAGGGNGLWDTVTNWAGDTAPVAGAGILFRLPKNRDFRLTP